MQRQLSSDCDCLMRRGNEHHAIEELQLHPLQHSASALPNQGSGDISRQPKPGQKELGRDWPQWIMAACLFSGEEGNLWWALQERSYGAVGRGIAVEVGRRVGRKGCYLIASPSSISKYEDELSLVWKVADGLIVRFCLARAK